MGKIITGNFVQVLNVKNEIGKRWIKQLLQLTFQAVLWILDLIFL
jgi:hypothetical protein